MDKLLNPLCPLTSVGIGIYYSYTHGPFVQAENSIVPSSSLASSGSEAGFLISLALLSFIVSLVFTLISIVWPMKRVISRSVYIVNYIFYLLVLFLVNLDVPLITSVEFGDWPLLVGLVIPTVMFYLLVQEKQQNYFRQIG